MFGKKFSYEPPRFCCSGGDIEAASDAYPSKLIRLFTYQDNDDIHFRTYGRLYNNLFCFSSLGGKFESSTEKGIYIFKLHGKIYHFVPNQIHNSNKRTTKFLQLYLYDAQHEHENLLGLFLIFDLVLYV